MELKLIPTQRSSLLEMGLRQPPEVNRGSNGRVEGGPVEKE